MKKYSCKYLSYGMVERIITGDAEAVAGLVVWYMPYIKKLSQGDREIEDRVTAKLMSAALQFQLDYKG